MRLALGTTVQARPRANELGLRRKDALSREAARILSHMIAGAHLTGQKNGVATVEFQINIETFDRLCLWGTSSEDFEPEAIEDDGDLEEHPIE